MALGSKVQQVGENFTIPFKKELVQVSALSIDDNTVYKIHLPNKAPVFITKFEDSKGNNSWTCLPQGEYKLAIELGKLIDSYNDTPKQQNLF